MKTGNMWKESEYDGYIGGKDYFVLLAKMNDHTNRSRKLVFFIYITEMVRKI